MLVKFFGTRSAASTHPEYETGTDLKIALMIIAEGPMDQLLR